MKTRFKTGSGAATARGLVMHRAVTPRRGRFCATPRCPPDALAGQVFDLAALPDKQIYTSP
jgi:hypothetical protein